jgi:hypothetical protein
MGKNKLPSHEKMDFGMAIAGPVLLTSKIRRLTT